MDVKKIEAIYNRKICGEVIYDIYKAWLSNRFTIYKKKYGLLTDRLGYISIRKFKSSLSIRAVLAFEFKLLCVNTHFSGSKKILLFLKEKSMFSSASSFYYSCTNLGIYVISDYCYRGYHLFNAYFFSDLERVRIYNIDCRMATKIIDEVFDFCELHYVGLHRKEASISDIEGITVGITEVE